MFCILVGLLTTLYIVARQRWGHYFRNKRTAPERTISLAKVSLQLRPVAFSSARVLARGDIASLPRASREGALGKLALLAVIQAFLNVFLARELEAEKGGLKKATGSLLRPEASP